MKLFLYIDPGTGSMLFTILIGVLGTALYFFRDALVKLRFLFGGGAHTRQETDRERIPFAIFTDSKRYQTIFEPICEEFEKRGEELVYMTASPDDPILNKSYENVRGEFIGEGNKGFAKLNFLKADVLLSSTPGLDVYQWKRSRDVKWYVHVAHAANDPAMYRMFGLDYYDAVAISGDYQRDQLRELEAHGNVPRKELPMIGLPSLDTLLKRLEDAPPLPPHPVTLLLAPSWGINGIFNRFGGEILKQLLATGYHVIARPHPQTMTTEREMIDAIMKEYPASDQLEWNFDNDNFEVLRRSDLLISDFSGIIFDYALVFQHPVIYADVSYDKGPYDAWWLKEELWTFETLPKIGRQLTPENFGQLKAIIDDLLENPQYQQAIEQARKETWACMGRSVPLLVDYMIEKRRELLGEKSAENDGKTA